MRLLTLLVALAFSTTAAVAQTPAVKSPNTSNVKRRIGCSPLRFARTFNSTYAQTFHRARTKGSENGEAEERGGEV